MTSLVQILQHLLAFYTVVVVNCVKYPENLKYCVNDLDVWFWPQVHRDIMRLSPKE